MLFATQLKNWNPADGLAKFNPEVIIVSILSSFGVFDVNDDGFIEFVRNLKKEKKFSMKYFQY